MSGDKKKQIGMDIVSENRADILENARDIDKVAILLAGMVMARRQSERDKGRKGGAK